MESFDLIPVDTLFFRDARPLAAGSSFGRGARWPLPTALHGALRTALLSAVDALPMQSRPGAMRKGVPSGQIGTDAFQWLHVHGPFPVREGKIYLPRPADLVAVEGEREMRRLLPIQRKEGATNLPTPLQYCIASGARAEKEEHPIHWIDSAFYEEYLAGGKLSLPEDPGLWDSERRIGVAIDPVTYAAKEGRLYVAEHLRLREGVVLRFGASSPPAHKWRHPEERGLTVASLSGQMVNLGGEGRFVRVEPVGDSRLLPALALRQGMRIKWVLLAPAVFTHGWRPGWVDDSGAVRLRWVDKESRREYRRRRREDRAWVYREEEDPAERIGAHLVAACLGKPEPIGGW
ncbi:type III-B CRISPR module-associated Cmr3 family protein, partial [Methylacidimicrobium tartarophylax]|uniref:type III-B CRISPR module-associated Cmr3 family protein n=1 Tax=Methylacidimicrobium tartarophylax TaxID=1041768 RepID=UPI001156F1D0